MTDTYVGATGPTGPTGTFVEGHTGTTGSTGPTVAARVVDPAGMPLTPAKPPLFGGGPDRVPVDGRRNPDGTFVSETPYPTQTGRELAAALATASASHPGLASELKAHVAAISAIPAEIEAAVKKALVDSKVDEGRIVAALATIRSVTEAAVEQVTNSLSPAVSTERVQT